MLKFSVPTITIYGFYTNSFISLFLRVLGVYCFISFLFVQGILLFWFFQDSILFYFFIFGVILIIHYFVDYLIKYFLKITKVLDFFLIIIYDIFALVLWINIVAPFLFIWLLFQ